MERPKPDFEPHPGTPQCRPLLSGGSFLPAGPLLNNWGQHATPKWHRSPLGCLKHPSKKGVPKKKERKKSHPYVSASLFSVIAFFSWLPLAPPPPKNKQQTTNIKRASSLRSGSASCPPRSADPPASQLPQSAETGPQAMEAGWMRILDQIPPVSMVVKGRFSEYPNPNRGEKKQRIRRRGELGDVFWGSPSWGLTTMGSEKGASNRFLD